VQVDASLAAAMAAAAVIVKKKTKTLTLSTPITRARKKAKLMQQCFSAMPSAVEPTVTLMATSIPLVRLFAQRDLFVTAEALPVFCTRFMANTESVQKAYSETAANLLSSEVDMLVYYGDTQSRA
jgi:hypothetical protein